MNLDSYQDATQQYALYPEDEELSYLTLGLVSEAGELADKVKKYYRDERWDNDEVAKELGDVLWYTARFADRVLGMSLSEIAEINLEKLRDRKARNTLSGSGDCR